MVYKRKRVYAPRAAPYKRRRFARRRLARRRRANGRRVRTGTTLSGYGSMLPFKSRRMSRMRWKRSLWNATNHLTHFRSNFVKASNYATPADNTTFTDINMYATQTAGGDPFWTATGGLLNVDTSEALTPLDNDNITVRGGQLTCSVINLHDSAVDGAVMRIYLIKTGKGFSESYLASHTFSQAAQPEDFADFRTYVGKIVLRKECILKDNEDFSVSYRLPGPYKIDYNDYKSHINDYVWFVLLGNIGNGEAKNMNVKVGWNMSFTGFPTTTIPT